MSATAKHTKRKRAVGRALTVGFLTVLFCAFGGFFIVLEMARDDSARLPTDLDRAKRLGLPLTAGDLRILSHVPDTENAAPLYIKAMKQLTAIDTAKTVASRTAYDFNYDVDVPNLTPPLVEALEPAMTTIRAAGRFPKCDFNERWEFGLEQSFFGDRFMYTLTTLANGLARFEIRRGSLNAGFADLEALIGLAIRCPDFGSLGLGMARARAQQMVLSDLWLALQLHPNDQYVQREVERIASSIQLQDIRQRMKSDFVLERITIRQMKSLKETGLTKDFPNSVSETIDGLLNIPGVRQALEAKFVKMCLLCFESNPEADGDWLAARSKWTRILRLIISDTSLDNAIAKSILARYCLRPFFCASTQARQRMILTAVGLLRHRLTSHRFPDILPPLGTTIIDPLSGVPFGYKRTSGGFMLISVGSVGWPEIDSYGHALVTTPEGKGEIVFEFTEP